MKYIVVLLMLVVAMGSLMAQVNGEISQLGDKTVLKIWGNHYQRGYAQGYLLADEIKEVFTDYFYTMQVFSDQDYYNQLWDFTTSSFAPDNRFITECTGIAEGMAASSAGAYVAVLGRNLEAQDLLMLNASVDLAYLESSKELQLGCASLASWGSSTQADEILQGSAVITRFLDWTTNTALIGNPLLVVHFPSEPDEMRWVNFTFPGFIGAITALNEELHFASMNTGNDHYYNDLNGLNPILYSIRSGIERRDYDQNGIQDADDLYSAIQSKNHLAGFIVQNLLENGGEAYNSVIETNNGGTARRLYNQSGDLPGLHLAATNHFRVLSYPTCCTRYVNIQDSLYTNRYLSAKRQWNVLSGAAGMDNNLMAIQYIPAQDYLLWAVATANTPAFARPAVTFAPSQLFSHPVSNNDDHLVQAPFDISVYPNPFGNPAELRLETKSEINRVEIFNLRGQRIYNGQGRRNSHSFGELSAEMPNGIYLIRVSDTQGNTGSCRILKIGS